MRQISINMQAGNDLEMLASVSAKEITDNLTMLLVIEFKRPNISAFAVLNQ
jgi:hypothetical protein